MPATCVVSNCRNTHKDGVSLFSFPRCARTCSLWARFVRELRPDWAGPGTQSRLCSAHFTEGDFEPSSLTKFRLRFSGRLSLKPDSLPSVHSPAAGPPARRHGRPARRKGPVSAPGTKAGRDQLKGRIEHIRVKVCRPQTVPMKWIISEDRNMISKCEPKPDGTGARLLRLCPAEEAGSETGGARDFPPFLEEGQTQTSAGEAGLDMRGKNDKPASMPVKKRRTWREEKRSFQQQWEMKFLVFLKLGTCGPEQVAVCALCRKELHQIKSYSMQRHYSTHAEEVESNYKSTFERHMLLKRAKNEHNREARHPGECSLSEPDQFWMTGLKVAFVLGQHGQPFSEGESVKRIVLAVEPDSHLFTLAPLSAEVLQERAADIVDFLQDEMAEKISRSPFYSLSVNESRDWTGHPRVVVGVRYLDYDVGCFQERTLCLATLSRNSCVKDAVQAVKDRLSECHLSLTNLCGLTVDGAALLQNKRSEFQRCFQEGCAQELFVFSCCTHPCLTNRASVKTMSDVESLIKRVLFITSSSCPDRWKFAQLWEKGDQSNSVLLTCNPVHWISMNDNVQKLFELWDELTETLTDISPDLLQELLQPQTYGCLLFLKEFLPKVSFFHQNLQDSHLNIFDAIEQVSAFRLGITQIALNLDDSPVLTEFAQFLKSQEASMSKKICLTAIHYLKVLSKDLEDRYHEAEFLCQYTTFVTDPFLIASSSFISVESVSSAFQKRLATFFLLNLTDFQYFLQKMRDDEAMKEYFLQPNIQLEKFWSNMLQFSEYKMLAKIALLFLALFPTGLQSETVLGALHSLSSKHHEPQTEGTREVALLLSQETRQVENFPFCEVLNFCKHRRMLK
ncbi:THA10 protein, partial [Amia calva]|nr:THA10 protein [Amia calva]